MFQDAAPIGQAIAIVNGNHKLIPISELQAKINERTRYLPEALDVRVVTCTQEGFQEVFWINYKDYRKLEG